jgi:Flp pilus assembly pilin Flp
LIEQNVHVQEGNNTMETINTWMLEQYVAITSAFKKEEGQTFAEYALIFALVVIVAMAGLTPLGTNILAKFNAVATALGA